MLSDRTARLRFHSGPTRSGPMTWGQESIARSIDWVGGQNNYFNVPHPLPLADGASRQDVLDAIRLLVERHEGLRTSFGVPGGRAQTVHAEGEVVVHLREAAAADLDAEAAALLAELGREAIGDGEPQVRWGLVSADGAPRRLLAVFSHQVVDAWSIQLIEDELLALMRDGDGHALPPALQPFDRLEREASPELSEASRRSVSRWRTTLPGLPDRVLGAPGEPETPRVGTRTLLSRALAAASWAVAERTGTSTSSVLLAATTLAVAVLGGHERVGMQLIVGNRYDPASRLLVAPTAQDGLFDVRVDAPTFDAHVRAVQRSAMRTYMSSCYRPEDVLRVRDEVAAETGRRADLSAYFNDIRLTEGWRGPAPRPVTPDSLADLVRESYVRVGPGWDRQDATLFVTVDAGPEGTASVRLDHDTCHLSGGLADRVLRGIEALVVAAAPDDIAQDRAFACLGLPSLRPAAHAPTALNA